MATTTLQSVQSGTFTHQSRQQFIPADISQKSDDELRAWLSKLPQDTHFLCPDAYSRLAWLEEITSHGFLERLLRCCTLEQLSCMLCWITSTPMLCSELGSLYSKDTLRIMGQAENISRFAEVVKYARKHYFNAIGVSDLLSRHYNQEYRNPFSGALPENIKKILQNEQARSYDKDVQNLARYDQFLEMLLQGSQLGNLSEVELRNWLSTQPEEFFQPSQEMAEQWLKAYPYIRFLEHCSDKQRANMLDWVLNVEKLFISPERRDAAESVLNEMSKLEKFPLFVEFVQSSKTENMRELLSYKDLLKLQKNLEKVLKIEMEYRDKLQEYNDKASADVEIETEIKRLDEEHSCKLKSCLEANENLRNLMELPREV